MDIPTLTLAFYFTSPGPIIYQLGPLSLRWYGLLIALAVVFGILIAQYLAQHRNVNPEIIGDLGVWLVPAAIICARLYYVTFEWRQYVDNPWDVFAIWKGGIAIHGAILGGLLAGLIFAKRQKISFWQLTDLIAPSLILGQAIGRWGNFFNSEAFGRPTDLPWKLYIPLGNRPINYQNFEFFHPTFLYESLWNLTVFTLLITLFFRGLKGKPHLKLGTIFMVYLVTYSCGRFWIEGLRTDSLMLGPLRIAQVVSLTGIILGLAGLAWLYLFQRSLPDVITHQTNDNFLENAEMMNNDNDT